MDPVSVDGDAIESLHRAAQRGDMVSLQKSMAKLRATHKTTKGEILATIKGEVGDDFLMRAAVLGHVGKNLKSIKYSLYDTSGSHAHTPLALDIARHNTPRQRRLAQRPRRAPHVYQHQELHPYSRSR